MGKLLTALNISEDVQKTLPENVIMGEKILMGFQKIYSESPESPRKELLAKAISDGVFQLLEEIKNPTSTTPPAQKWYIGKTRAEITIKTDQIWRTAEIFRDNPKYSSEYVSVIADWDEALDYVIKNNIL